jgi:L-threonylcarbamoyladenylate synthase
MGLNVTAAAHWLAQGGLVGMPTETVYGLAAHADDPAAVARIFEAKGRPKDHPLIVHIGGTTPTEWQDGVNHYATDVPAFALALMNACWPGPLTLILPRRAGVGETAAGGQPSIGLRCPRHPVAQALLAACKAQGIWGLAAPSANRFGRVSPTTVTHVANEFPELLAHGQLQILDGGPCDVGIESTIVDCTRGRPVLLRPGMVQSHTLEQISGMTLQARDEAAPKASGTLESHYAPAARVRLMPMTDIQAALQLLGPQATHIACYTRNRLVAPEHTGPRHAMPLDAESCAQELFAVLRALDQPGIQLIWVETPPPDSAWDGVRDRLQRAAA